MKAHYVCIYSLQFIGLTRDPSVGFRHDVSMCLQRWCTTSETERLSRFDSRCWLVNDERDMWLSPSSLRSVMGSCLSSKHSYNWCFCVFLLTCTTGWVTLSWKQSTCVCVCVWVGCVCVCVCETLSTFSPFSPESENVAGLIIILFVVIAEPLFCGLNITRFPSS